MIEDIWGGRAPGELIAVWVHNHQPNPKTPTEFLTKPKNDLQVAVIQRKEGEVIEAHRHAVRMRSLTTTQEVLLVCEGRMRFDLYDSQGDPVRSDVAHAGDILILCRGGHGFQMLDDTTLIEIKQGPYNVLAPDKIFLSTGRSTAE